MKYWPTWLGLGLLRLIHLLPYRLQLFVGRYIGRLYRMLATRRAGIARRNLALCFPSLDDQARERLLERHFESLGVALIESAMCWWGSERQIKALGRINGLHHLEQALQSGRGVILLSGHMSAMELGGHILALHTGIGAMYRPMKNQVMEQLVARSRRRHLSVVFPRDQIRTMIRCLKAGRAIWYGFDQNYGLQHGVFVPFFGVEAATITTTSRFAKSANALVIPFFPYRDDRGRCRIEILPPLEGFPSDDTTADTRRLNGILEQAIMQAPEQYLWIHRRFKTRPEGQPALY